MKLANWNLERAATPSRRKILRDQTDAIAADVWIFTETHDDFTPGLPHACSSASGRDGIPGLDKPSDRWVSVYSRFPLEQLPTQDAIRTAAARIFPDNAAPFIAFGTVLPWSGNNWRGHRSAGGAAFREALNLQLSDWKNLRREYPDDELFVLGDFNQDLVHPRYYGSRLNQTTLRTALNECGLVALTAGDGDPIRRDSPPYACIDHICSLRDSRWLPQPAMRWPDTPKPDKRLSDHFGLAVTFVCQS